LTVIGNLLSNHGTKLNMDYGQIRALLAIHFGRMLTAKKDELSREPLNALEAASLRITLSEGPDDNSTSLEAHSQLFALDSMIVDQVLTQQGQPTTLTPLERQMLIREYRRANVAYAEAVLKHDEKSHGYSFQNDMEGGNSSPSSTIPAQGPTLSEVVGDFFKYAAVEGRWIEKTKGEKSEHIDLLYEAVGRELAIADFGRTKARKLRDILVAYPVNRFKMPQTKNKTLDELANLTGVKTLHPRTINKYLQTYSGLFGWAKQNGYVAENPFAGLNLGTGKLNTEEPRLPFPDAAVKLIANTLTDPARELPAHHKWGSLIALYSGARLNEVAQLDLDDLRQVDGVWCIDINAQGPTKKLKNAASRRKVPIHPQLISLGLLDYAAKVRRQGSSQRLFPQFTYTSSDGYGRNLGRWFNESLLPSLGLKTKQLTFHSLRHTVIERLIAADVSQAHIMAIVGHEPGTTTLKTYNRNGFPPTLLLAALERILQT